MTNYQMLELLHKFEDKEPFGRTEGITVSRTG